MSLVAGFMGDPLVYGIHNPARPRGNVTGFHDGTANGKGGRTAENDIAHLERLGILGGPTIRTFAGNLAARSQTAQALGIQVLTVDVRSVTDVDAAFATALAWSADALLVISTASFTAGVYARVAELAAEHRLPVMFRGPGGHRPGRPRVQRHDVPSS